jgi:hypothetical protein
MARSSPRWSALVGSYPVKGLPGSWAPDLLAAVQDVAVGDEPLCPVLIVQPKHRYKAVPSLYFMIIMIIITTTNCN